MSSNKEKVQLLWVIAMKNMKLMLVAFLLSLLFSCSENNSDIPEMPGSIEGKVISAQNDELLKNVQIETYPPTNVLLTDSIGQFKISSVKPGIYKLYFTKLDYHNKEVNVMVESGKVVYAYVSLYPSNQDIPTDSDSLVLHLPFDANINDISKNNMLSESYNIQFIPDRKNNNDGAVFFNGVDSYVRIKSNQKLNLGINYSISLWFKPDLQGGKRDTNGGVAVLGRWDKYGFGESSFGMSHHPNGDVWFGTHDGNYKGTGVYATSVLTDGLWHHIVYVKSGTNGWIYVNGLVVANNSNLQHAQQTNYDLYIGRMNHDRSFFKGAIDELYIFNKALNTNEIQDLYNK